MARVVLLLPKHTYRSDFVDAAESLGVDIVVASDFRQAMSASMGERAVLVDFDDPTRSAEVLAELHTRTPLDAVLATDERGVVLAAAASRRLGLPANPTDAVQATRDKSVLRAALHRQGVPQPRFAVVDRGGNDAREAVRAVGGLPVVCKPLHLSASQGVIRVDDAASLAETLERVRRIACDENAPVLVEQYVPGVEVAVEALLHDGRAEVLAVFDKPDPLVGPYFEETIYVTPSRLPAPVLERVGALVGRAAAALGLRYGPVHAEVRVDIEARCVDGGAAARSPGAPMAGEGEAMWVIEVAARSIGGLCSRTLRFGLGVSLEQIILRDALGMGVPALRRERAASGVMMLPIPQRGVLDRVDGVDAASAVAGVAGIEITVHPGTELVPLPEGDRYLGFLFARGASPAEVEASLRAGAAELQIVLR